MILSNLSRESRFLISYQVLRNLFLLAIPFFVIGCSLKGNSVIFVGGEASKQFIEQHKNSNYEFRQMEYEVPNTENPVYVRGKYNDDEEFFEIIINYFGGNMEVYKGHYKNHNYFYSSGLYLPSNRRRFTGDCDDKYIELIILSNILKIKISEWKTNRYFEIFLGSGLVDNIDGVWRFSSTNKKLNINFIIEENEESKKNYFQVLKSNSHLLSSCVFEERNNLLIATPDHPPLK